MTKVSVKFPRHITLTIDHNAFAANYETASQFLADDHNRFLFADLGQADIDEMKRTGEVWSAQWYPDTPIGFCCRAAATFDRLLEMLAEVADEESDPALAGPASPDA